jgi:hypothetical protein
MINILRLEGLPPPPRLRDAIEKLRRLTLTSTDLSAPWGCFHDEIAAFAGVCTYGRKADDARLRDVVERIAAHVAPSVRPAAAMLTFRLDDFSHGVLEASPCPIVYYHFGREDRGALGFTAPPLDRLMVRFSIVAEVAPHVPFKVQTTPA